VTYFEALDINKGALDAGQGLVPAPGKNPWANILEMTGNVQGLKTRRAVARGRPRLGAFHGVTLRRGCALHKCFG
jgi:hypothetical protein